LTGRLLPENAGWNVSGIRREFQEPLMENLRSALLIASVGFGLLATVAWIGLIGYGVFELAKFTLVELDGLIL
jgi:hypothetical protein